MGLLSRLDRVEAELTGGNAPPQARIVLPCNGRTADPGDVPGNVFVLDADGPRYVAPTDVEFAELVAAE